MHPATAKLLYCLAHHLLGFKIFGLKFSALHLRLAFLRIHAASISALVAQHLELQVFQDSSKIRASCILHSQLLLHSTLPL